MFSRLQPEEHAMCEVENTAIASLDAFSEKATRLLSIDVDEAEAALRKVLELSRDLKSEKCISKDLMRSIWWTILALSNEAPNMGDQQKIAISLAGRFENVFGMILQGRSDLDLPPLRDRRRR
jgi:hypothetical protein